MDSGSADRYLTLPNGVSTQGVGGNMFAYCGEEAKLPSSSSHIRLLELHPPASQSLDEPSVQKWFDSPIHCTIKTAPIESPPRFKALSYCWGLGGPTQSITINGLQFRITASLDCALRHLRCAETVVLWIDQICINQRDRDEKTDQVRIMDLIYSQSCQVLIWLGQSDQDSDDAMDFYDKIGRAAMDIGFQNYYTKENWPVLQKILLERNPEDERWKNLEGLIAKTIEELLRCLQPLVDLDKRPWFTRVWVIQEFCLPKDPWFVCGDRSVPIDFIRHVRQVISFGSTAVPGFLTSLCNDDLTLLHEINISDPSPAFFGARAQRQKYERGEGPGDTLLEVLRKVYVDREAVATQAEDRLFSLLGLAVDSGRLDVKADYTKPPPEALRDAARAIIQGGDLAILSYAQFPKDHTTLPSWVPDWRPKLKPSFYPYPRRGEANLFAPSVDRKPVVLPSPDSDVLGLAGLLVDTIEDVGRVWSDEGWDPLRHQTYLAQVRFLCQLSAMKGEPIYSSEERRREAVWRVPIGDIYDANQPGGSLRAENRAEKAFKDLGTRLAWFEGCKIAKTTEEFEAGMAALPDDQAAGLYRLSMAKMNGKRPFITRRGYVGICAPVAGQGDLVVVFLGARVCSVLRQRERSGYVGACCYLGEAYCDGVMDGELLGKRMEEEFYMI